MFRTEGNGLVTGNHAIVEVDLAPAGSGITFVVDDEAPLPARLEFVTSTDRGVTLGHRNKPMLFTVEHFLSACSLAGLSDANVRVHGSPELPILDGSAQPWLEMLIYSFGYCGVSGAAPGRTCVLHESIAVCSEHGASVIAEPADEFSITYEVDFEHADLRNKSVEWSIREGAPAIAPARTFGFVHELSTLQARGLAKGATKDNVLGLTNDDGYTSHLRLKEEPIRHKMIDLIGDLTLMGINPLSIGMHIHVTRGGHTAHVAFARKLAALISP